MYNLKYSSHNPLSISFNSDATIFDFTLKSLNLTKIGAVDASVGWSKTKGRKPYFLFSDSILDRDVVFFYSKDYKFDWNNINDLKNINIGTVPRYKYENKINNLKRINGVKIHEVINEQKLFLMLI